jgi:hypothetical protein
MIDWDYNPPGKPPDNQGQRQSLGCADRRSCVDPECKRCQIICNGEEYVLRVRYDELKAKYERLVLQSGGGISQSDLIDRRPRGVGQRHSTVEASPSPVVHNNIDARGIHITEVGRDVHYHLLTISNGNMTIAILVVFLD